MKNFHIPKPSYYSFSGMELELNLPRENWMQDWPIEVIKAEHFFMLVEYYDKVNENHKKYFLILAIIDSIRMTAEENIPKVLPYLEKVKTYLITDFKVHEYLIFNWIVSISLNINSKFNKFSSDLLKIYNEQSQILHPAFETRIKLKNGKWIQY